MLRLALFKAVVALNKNVAANFEKLAENGHSAITVHAKCRRKTTDSLRIRN